MTTPKQEQTTAADESRLNQHGKLSYLEIPARNPRQSAAFYTRVFGWNLRGDSDRPSFDDSSGGMIGRWVAGRAISGEAGLLPYIYVQSIDDAVQQVIANGGEIVQPVYAEGDLWLAMFHDPAGNLLGIWQRGPR